MGEKLSAKRIKSAEMPGGKSTYNKNVLTIGTNQQMQEQAVGGVLLEGCLLSPRKPVTHQQAGMTATE